MSELPMWAARVVTALVPVVCPSGAQELRLADAITAHVGAQLAAFPLLIRRGFLLGMAVYDQSARAAAGHRGQPAHRLSQQQQLEYFHRWQHSPSPVHRRWADAAKRLLTMACYEQPELLARLGYSPKAWVDKVTRRRLAQYRSDIDKAAEAVFLPDPLRPARPAQPARPAHADAAEPARSAAGQQRSGHGEKR